MTEQEEWLEERRGSKYCPKCSGEMLARKGDCEVSEVRYHTTGGVYASEEVNVYNYTCQKCGYRCLFPVFRLISAAPWEPLRKVDSISRFFGGFLLGIVASLAAAALLMWLG